MQRNKKKERARRLSTCDSGAADEYIRVRLRLTLLASQDFLALRPASGSYHRRFFREILAATPCSSRASTTFLIIRGLAAKFLVLGVHQRHVASIGCNPYVARDTTAGSSIDTPFHKNATALDGVLSR